MFVQGDQFYGDHLSRGTGSGGLKVRESNGFGTKLCTSVINKTFTVVLILQPNEPYVSYIGSNGDYNPFVYQAGISSMDIRFMGGPESMQNLSMVFPTRFTSKRTKVFFFEKVKILKITVFCCFDFH